MLDATIDQLAAGNHLTMESMTRVMDCIMLGDCDEQKIAQFLKLLHEKGETVEEIAGAAHSLRRHMTRIRTERTGLIDTCGTGGDGSGTFNISTAAAIVTAACGVPVAKHGNRRITSKSGSVDVLAALGVNVEASLATVERCLDQVGICFCFAPLMHPSMKHVAAVRKQLKTPTIFNLLGPLCNPASANHQLLGVGKPDLRLRIAAALQRLGTQRSAVVCGEDGLDEVTLNGATHVALIQGGALDELTWSPSDFGLQETQLESLQVDGPEASAVMIRQILEGRCGPPRDIVLLNTAAALWIAGTERDLPAAVQRAASSIDDGRALRLLHQLADVSHTT